MPLNDYDYIMTLGTACCPCSQVRRVAESVRLDRERFAGPFDWCVLNLQQATQVLSRDFTGYFAPDSLSASVLGNGHWTVTDSSGVVAWHQLPATAGESAPSAMAWFAFGTWLGARIQNWRSQRRRANANILLIRDESPFEADVDEDMLRMTEVLKRQIAGRFTVLWLRYGGRLTTLADPSLRTVEIRPAWPEGLAAEHVDYDRDYGFGTAWRGRDDDWDRVWRSI